MSDLVPPPTDGPLTPNTLTAAEEALKYNEALQTSSAGRPQPTTPTGPSRQSSNYAAAALHSGFNPSAPYPASLRAGESTDSAASEEHEDVAAAFAAALEPGKLSRGTTQAVLAKMESPEFGSALGKRMGREGERRTRLVPVKSNESAEAERGGGKKPGLDRQQSWSQEDAKRAMTERLMGPVDDGEGYSSAGGAT